MSQEPAGQHDPDKYDLTESDQETAGSMGVSSERVGPVGPGQVGTSGVRGVGPLVRAPGTPVRPGQSRGGPEANPDPASPPKAGYPSHHPLSKKHPYRKGRQDTGR